MGQVIRSALRAGNDFFKRKKIKDKKNLKKCTSLNPCCRFCDSSTGLWAHHIRFVSEGGDDSLDNLISLCFNCHRKAHDGYYSSAGVFVSSKDFMIHILEKLQDERYDKALKYLRSK